MSELSPRARAFLDAHRRDGTPTPADAERVRAALAPKLGPPPRSFPWVKAGLIATAGLALVLGARQLSSKPVAEAAPSAPPAVARSSLPPSPAPAPMMEVPAVEPKHEVAPPPLAPAPKPGVSTRREPATPSSPAVAPTPEPAAPEPTPAVAVAPEPPVEPVVEPPPPPVARPDELTLVSEAEDQLRKGRPGGALELLTRWESHFGEGRGQFEQEARAARVVAVCQTGDLESGRTEARAYFAKFPKALARNRIERACTNSANHENH